jgi:hypothetical protein
VANTYALVAEKKLITMVQTDPLPKNYPDVSSLVLCAPFPQQQWLGAEAAHTDPQAISQSASLSLISSGVSPLLSAGSPCIPIHPFQCNPHVQQSSPCSLRRLFK